MRQALSGDGQDAAYALKHCLNYGPYEKIDTLLTLLSLEQGEVFSLLLRQAELLADGTVSLPPFFRDDEDAVSPYSEYSFWTTLSLMKEKPLWVYAVEKIRFTRAPLEEPFRLPVVLKYCPSLRSLSLEDCQLQSFPELLLDLRKLRQLSLRRNRLKSIPSGIGRLRQLVYFNAAENDLEHLPLQLGHLRKLNILDLSGNSLSSPGFSFSRLTRLNALNLSGNCLDRVPEGLNLLNQLEQVDLSFNDLPADEEAAWESCHFSLIKNYQWHLVF